MYWMLLMSFVSGILLTLLLQRRPKKPTGENLLLKQAEQSLND
ncbi:smp protein, putative [Vibrio cholerae B33]|nr:smp protein, putative [Vibrio cholerae B33]